jgi:hypothetical protein
VQPLLLLRSQRDRPQPQSHQNVSRETLLLSNTKA